MKKIISFIAVIAIALSANAQIVSSRSTSITTSKGNFPNYNRIYVGFASQHVTNYFEGDAENFPGIVGGYLYGISLSSTMPIYLEAGFNVQYNSKSDTYKSDGYYSYKEELKFKYLGISIPVNATYRFDMGNGIILAPYTGFHLRTNILAKAEEDGKEYDLFDKDDVKDTAKRVQFGWQIGGNFSYKALNVGFEYGIDFNKFINDSKTSTFLATIGLNF